MTLLQSWLTRLIVGGFLCFLATAAAGKGAASEPVRLACACLMILLVLRPGTSLDMQEVLSEIEAAERSITQSVEDAQAERNDRMAQALAARFGALLGEPEGAVIVTLDESGAVQSVTIRDSRGDPEEMRTRLSAVTGLSAEQIVIVGEYGQGKVDGISQNEAP